ncbi:dTMP kinase [Mycoplasma miroungirhinis]|uniref:Thymidylate kinase n=1 Tax=Mycoplasma miroungirhinis TaxID=754516 RepID=A0A6M4JAY3_9MOLU|nr:dTMP kinase [Mycoplasma miroungirhinis]QJR44070.1 dTMP kinase [Mycoplasma miroungirhinis]
MQRAKFITFEGMDGSGKTTIISKLKEKFIEENIINNFIFTREPGSSKSTEAEKIRNFILDNDNNLSPAVEALLFAASRRINLEKAIWPALENNKIVISDRYYHSSLIYQGFLGGVGIEQVREINMVATNYTIPDLIIFFDLKPEISLKRITENRLVLDRMETIDLEYYKKLYEGYKKLIDYEPDRFVIIDASQSIENVLNDVLNVFKKRVL